MCQKPSLRIQTFGTVVEEIRSYRHCRALRMALELIEELLDNDQRLAWRVTARATN